MSLALACLMLTVNWAQGQNQSQQDYLAQGDVLLRTGAHELALEKYRAGMERDLIQRAVYQKRSIETLLRMGRRSEAFEINAQLLQEHPDDTDGLGLRAAGLLDQGDAAAAIALLQQVIQRAPDNAVAHLDLGRAYAAQHKDELARREMEEAIRLRPDFLRAKRELAKLDPRAARHDLAVLFEAAGRHSEAAQLVELDQAVRSNEHALTMAFLQTELAVAGKRLEVAQAQRDPEAIRQAQITRPRK